MMIHYLFHSYSLKIVHLSCFQKTNTDLKCENLKKKYFNDANE